MEKIEYIEAKTIVTGTKDSSWFGTDYNMNIYKGCSHGCIYCDSRSDCYRVKAFDMVKVKKDALRIIRDDLRRKVKKGVVATGSMSDPYNPLEQEQQLTRHALELLHAFSFGAAIATKSPLVTRDIDVLQDVKKQSPLIVMITITTVEDELCQKIEPNVAVSRERFKAIKELSDYGIFCGVLLMPLLPFLNDTKENVKQLLYLAKEHGARFVYPSFGVTLRDRQREYFYQKLDLLFPGLSERYVRKYGERYQCSSNHAKALYEVTKEECEKLALLSSMKGIVSAYKMENGATQLSFL